MEDYTAAEEIIREGQKKYPDFIGLVSESAEIAMVQCNWSEAICCWETVLSMSKNPSQDNFLLPKSGKIDDWWEGHWQAIALYLQSETDSLVSANLYTKIAEVLISREYLVEADQLLEASLKKYSTDLPMAVLYAKIAMKQKDWSNAINRWHSVINRQGNDIPVDAYSSLSLCYHLISDNKKVANIIKQGLNQNSYLANTIQAFKENEQILLNCKNQDLDKELTCLYMIRYHSNTMLAKQIQSGIYISKNEIDKLIEEMIPEKTGSVDNTWGFRFLRKVSRRISLRFSRTFKSKYLPQKVIADAIFPQILTCSYYLIPLRHLARKFACKHQKQLVFLELTSQQIELFPKFDSIELLFFYYELRKRGVNAFLCLKNESKNKELSKFKLKFFPGNFWSLKKLINKNIKKSKSELAIVPDGIRGVERIIVNYKDAHIFKTPAITFSLSHTNKYSVKQIEFTDSLYKNNLSPKSFDISFERLFTLKNLSEDGQIITDEVLISDKINPNLLYWLNYT
ncbi:MAG: hypothetical protein WBA93_30155, partial [Microcoleaceae cyanobacterium]